MSLCSRDLFRLGSEKKPRMVKHNAKLSRLAAAVSLALVASIHVHRCGQSQVYVIRSKYFSEGLSIRKIARDMGRSRNKVRIYLAEKCRLDLEAQLTASRTSLGPR
jgi:hypothetical protein